MNIPFLSFSETHSQVKSDILEQFEKFYDSNSYVLAENTFEFEKEYAYFNKVNYCIGVSNGLDALHLSLKALNIGRGDEVLVPSNTYIATVLAISYVGATPVFVEPKQETFNIDPSLIESSISSKTKAIMPVHLYGQSCEMTEIMQIANKYGLHIVEDNAQSQGATYNSTMTGAFGVVNATSFYPTKNLGALGEAGAVTTNDSVIKEKILALRNYGSREKYVNEIIGYNNRIDECQAAFLRIKLRKLNEWTGNRQSIANLYDKNLQDIEEIKIPQIAPNATSVYHLYVIKTLQRDKLKDYLLSKGIGTAIHYPIPPHLQSAYTNLNFKKGDFPIAEELADTSLSLPLYIGMTELQIKYIVDNIRSFFEKYKD